jgi:hypothetical protein
MKTPKGICSVCACVDEDACREGCAWANKSQTLCTACKGLTAEQRKEKRETNLEILRIRLENLTDEALEVKARMRVLA